MKELVSILMILIITAITLSITAGFIFSIIYSILQKTAKIIYVGLFYIESIGELFQFNIPEKGTKRLIMDLSANILLTVIFEFFNHIYHLSNNKLNITIDDIFPFPIAMVGMITLVILYYLSWLSKPMPGEEKEEFFDKIIKLKLPIKIFKS